MRVRFMHEKPWTGEKLQETGRTADRCATLLVACVLLGCSGTALALDQIADTNGQHYYDGARTFVDEEPAEIIRAVPELQGMQPAADQKLLPTILDRVGERVEVLLQTFPNTSSREDVTEERLNRAGQLEARHAESFSFLILAHRTANGERTEIEEFRTDSQGRPVKAAESADAFLSTRGFAGRWAHFYPGNRTGSRFRLLGQQEFNGHSAYVVAFAQRPGWSTIVSTIVVEQKSVVILNQGIAWIDAASYQLLRMRTDLLMPRDDIDLEKQTTEIEYGEVSLPGMPHPLWLPLDVTVTTSTKDRLRRYKTEDGVYTTGTLGKTYRNRHQYSEFKVFRSESTIKSIVPNQAGP